MSSNNTLFNLSSKILRCSCSNVINYKIITIEVFIILINIYISYSISLILKGFSSFNTNHPNSVSYRKSMRFITFNSKDTHAIIIFNRCYWNCWTRPCNISTIDFGYCCSNRSFCLISKSIFINNLEYLMRTI